MLSKNLLHRRIRQFVLETPDWATAINNEASARSNKADLVGSRTQTLAWLQQRRTLVAKTLIRGDFSLVSVTGAASYLSQPSVYPQRSMYGG